MTTHVMVDLETWSTQFNATIISIGAVKFDLFSLEVEDKFHVGVNPAALLPAVRKLFDLDPQTIGWWMEAERDEARKAWLALEKVDLPTALEGFAIWYGDDPTLPVWGNGATFDNVVLTTSYDLLGLKRPWGFRADRCYRTLRSLVPDVRPPKLGVVLSALDDAEYQAVHAQMIIRHLMERGV